MCGIAGIFHRDGAPASEHLLSRMTNAIAHRGPDGEGYFVRESIGLGHRRLSILDLSAAGHQPMLTTDQRYALTYNGEICNFREAGKSRQAAFFNNGWALDICLYGQ